MVLFIGGLCFNSGWIVNVVGTKEKDYKAVSGVLYIVATPIGNLGDFSPRGQQTLSSVDLVVAEDTRHSRNLLNHFGIEKPLVSLHEHNEASRIDSLIQRLLQGEDIAQISDAGTPLINDPGYLLARRAREEGIKVTAIPGPTAPIVALSLSGLPANRFSFEGFIPSRAGAREQFLQRLAAETRTLIFFESPRRIVESLHSMREYFGSERRVSVARELTKFHESIHTAPLHELIGWVESDPNNQRGEFVLVVEGAQEQEDDESEAYRIVEILSRELAPRKAAAVAAEITGVRKNKLYRSLME